MSIIEAIILGIIQGLTEFLPVSSSGHIEIGKAILGVQPTDPLLFSVVVHAATSLSTIVIFRKSIAGLFIGLFGPDRKLATRYILLIVLSMIPAAFVGLFFNDFIEAMFDSNILLVGLMLLVTAVLLLFTDSASDKNKKLTASNVFIIGISQAIAILPGISRSGATICTSILLGVSRAEAAKFSFLMVVPLIFGKMSKDVIDGHISLESEMFLPLIAGFIAAFIVGMIACQWMISIVKKSKLKYFAWYCIAVGLISILFHFI